MPLVIVQTIKGILDPSQKRQLLERLADVMVGDRGPGRSHIPAAGLGKDRGTGAGALEPGRHAAFIADTFGKVEPDDRREPMTADYAGLTDPRVCVETKKVKSNS